MSLIRTSSIAIELALKNITKTDLVQLERPKSLEFGDLTSNVAMILASKEKKSPQDLANGIITELKQSSGVMDVCDDIRVVAPGFINFYIKTDLIQQELDVILDDKKYGSSEIGKNKKVIIEYSSPNTNKPLHVGHLRNNSIGMCLANGLEFTGFKVVKTQVVNDRGVHIMKSILSYDRWGKNKTPKDADQKGDKFVGGYYVKFGKELENNPGLETEAQEMLEKWEAGDKDIRKLWEKMNDWIYSGWEETYKKFGSEFDKNYYESNLYTKGKEIVEKALEQGVVKKTDTGTVAIDLSEEGLGGRESGEKVLLRENGTTVYMTQDIYLAKNRFDDYDFDRLIYVVGDEQIYHFKVLFTILKKLGFDWTDKLLHYPYGQVLLPDGKMKSREGKVVDADELINEMNSFAKTEIDKRQTELSEDEKNRTAEAISGAAIKYWFLKNNQKTSIIFDPKQSLDFEGNSGPYLLYTYVRLGSILEKENVKNKVVKHNIENLGEEEIKALRLLMQWPQIMNDFTEHLQPNFICEYLFELASLMNSYYHEVPILKSEKGVRETRLALLQSVRLVLQNGLNILNINTVEKM